MYHIKFEEYSGAKAC